MQQPWDTTPTQQYGGVGYTAPRTSSPSPFASFGQTPAPTGGSGGYQPGAYGSTPDTYFDDPLSQPIMAAWGSRMQQLSRPAPSYGDISSTLGSYLQPDPRFNAGLAALAASAGGKAAQGSASSAKVLDNPYTKQYADATTQRMQELNADPFSTSDEAALKARFFDSLAMSRDDAYNQNAAEMARRGLDPGSGVAQALGAETSAGYQKARALQQQQLLQYVTDERNRRRDTAVQMSGALQGAGGQDTALKQNVLLQNAQNLTQASLQNASLANQWQATRAGILGNVLSAIQGQQGMGLNAATTMASLRRQQYLDDDARGNSLLETSALPSAIAQQRMAAMQQTLSGAPSSQSLYQQYLQQQQMAQQQDAYNSQKNAAIWGAVGNIGAGVANKLPWDDWLGGGSNKAAG